MDKDEKLLRRPDVVAKVGLSGTTIWRLVARGAFPAPIPISPGRVCWLQSEIEKWIAGKVEAARRAA